MRHVKATFWWPCLLLGLLVQPAASSGLLRINFEKFHVLHADHLRDVVIAPEHGHGHSGEEHQAGSEHSSAHEGSHEGGDHGHGHEAPDPAAVLVATMLLGMVAWIMSLFYFVNWPAPNVRQATWDTLSAMITIFCGVLLFSCIKLTMVDFAGEKEGGHHSPPNIHTLILSFVRFLVLFVVLQCTLFGCRKHPMRMKYIGCVGSHVVGFAAIDWLGSSMQMPMIATSMLNCVLGLLGCFLVLTLFYHPLALARRKYASDNEEFQEECDEFDGEAIALTVGLLVSMVVRKSVTGSLPPVHGAPKTKTETEILSLLAVSVVGGLCVVVVAYVYRKLEGSSYTVKRTAHMLRECASMTMGWCLLFTGYWFFYYETHDKDSVGGPMTMRIVMALAFSALTLFSIILLDFIADRSDEKYKESCRSLLVTFSLLMGLSWEACFSMAVENLGHFVEVTDSAQGFLGYGVFTSTLVTNLLSIALCIVVLPAWAWYILPATSACKHQHHEDKEKFDAWNA